MNVKKVLLFAVLIVGFIFLIGYLIEGFCDTTVGKLACPFIHFSTNSIGFIFGNINNIV